MKEGKESGTDGGLVWTGMVDPSIQMMENGRVTQELWKPGVAEERIALATSANDRFEGIFLFSSFFFRFVLFSSFGLFLNCLNSIELVFNSQH